MAETFDELLAKREALLAERSAFMDRASNPIQKEYEAAVVAEVRTLFPKARVKTLEQALKRLSDERAKELMAPFQARLEAWLTAVSERSKAIESALSKLAETEAFSPEARRTQWLRWQWIYGGAYSSQGYSADRYARGSAERYVDQAKALGVEAKIALSPGGFDVLVLVEGPRDVALLGLKKNPLTLRDQVKACLRAGLNPRVYNPFLPWGIEAELGLDYYGNDIAPKGA